MVGGIALRSGSSGNASLIKNGDACFLVDCGINGKNLLLALAEAGESPAAIDGILITHEHSDHVSGLGVVLRRYKIPVYISQKVFEAILPRLGKFDPSLIHIIEPETEFLIKDQSIRSFLVPHDAPETLGYRFMTAQGDITVCTDIGQITPEVMAKIEGSRLLFLESNYDPDLLNSGPYPWPLKQRIRNGQGHLSNLQCGEGLCCLVEAGAEQITLCHLSRENNHPAIAELASVQALAGIQAKVGEDYLIQVARRYDLSDWMQI